MADSILDLVALIKSSPNLSSGFPKLVDHCKLHKPDVVWDKIASIPRSDDVETATAWLTAQFEKSPVKSPTGIYLGLDTLNQKRDLADLKQRGLTIEQMAPAKNVELALSSKADPDILSMDWAYGDDNWYGSDHLIASLVPMKDLYKESKVSSFADYQLFLGYATMVLLETLERVAPPHPFLAICGFQDGDLLYLLRRTAPDTPLERLLQF